MIFVLFWIIKFVYQLGHHIRHRSVDTALVLPHQSHTSHLTLTPQWETWRGQVVSVYKTLKSDLWKTVTLFTLFNVFPLCIHAEYYITRHVNISALLIFILSWRVGKRLNLRKPAEQTVIKTFKLERRRITMPSCTGQITR